MLPYARAVKAAMREYRLDDSRLGADEDSIPDASTGGGGDPMTPESPGWDPDPIFI